MNQTQEIKARLKRQFTIGSSFDIHEDGTVDVFGDVYVHRSSSSHLVVKFGKVWGDFKAANCGLRTLENAPHTVNGSFYCYGNRLDNLEGGPLVVGRNYYAEDNNLHNFNGLANRIGGAFHFNISQLRMPLLRCLSASVVRITNIPLFDRQLELEKLLNDPRWIGKGKKGSLMCAAALIRAGFEEFAKW